MHGNMEKFLVIGNTRGVPKRKTNKAGNTSIKESRYATKVSLTSRVTDLLTLGTRITLTNGLKATKALGKRTLN